MEILYAVNTKNAPILYKGKRMFNQKLSQLNFGKYMWEKGTPTQLVCGQD